MALALQPSPKTLSPRPQAPDRPPQRANQPSRDLHLDRGHRTEPAAARPQRVQTGQAGPRRIGCEELHDLLLGRPRPGIPTASQPADEFEKGEVAGGQLIEPTLAGQRQLLERPAADPPDPGQPLPAALVVGSVEVDAARR